MRTLLKDEQNETWVVEYSIDDPDYQTVKSLFGTAIIPTPFHHCSLARLRELDTEGRLADCDYNGIIRHRR